jgi:NADH-quinone oxidoreductase subunit L
MLYLGWEGVGLCSYLLIGYYYSKPSAREAARKAFLVNRIGDFGFGIGIFLTFAAFGSVKYFSGDPSHSGFIEEAMKCWDLLSRGNPGNVVTPFQEMALHWIPFCLMLGAFGKSAQFPLYVWLPDAMEGPTPVSALIHAATMVTAGVYMIARCSALFIITPAAMTTVAAVGAFTALFAGTIALRQFDLKKVFAYSTVSQLGFMFAGVGMLAPVAGVFHLVTHAFFKALLFLSSGVVMHAMAGELDMRKMSGLRRVLPKTRILMGIGCLALAGFPPLAGFWSKDEVVGAAFERHTRGGTVIGIMLLVTAFLTAYYTFRLYFRVFEGPLVVPPEAEEHIGHVAHHAAHSAPVAQAKSGVDPHLAGSAHEEHTHHDPEPPLMIYPLYVLAAGALLAGFLNTPWAHGLGNFLGKSPSFANGFHMAWLVNGGEAEAVSFGQHADEHHTAWGLMILSALISALGIVVAYYLHYAERRKAEQIAEAIPGVARTLENKYWVDELYDLFIVRPLRAIGVVFFWCDRFVVDTTVWLVSFIPQAGGWMLKLGLQRGYLQGYAAAMLFGIAVILLIIFL